MPNRHFMPAGRRAYSRRMESTEDGVRFGGRILYLSRDPACVRAQIEGRDLDAASAMPLRDDISTDEITPVTVMLCYDERLGRYPYVGFEAGGERPIGPDAVRRGGFEVTVAGRRYGKGSSRESSPLAERSAGIRLIVAESFERIYRQNCDNLGILTTTDFGVLARIASGEAIPLEVFLRDRDALAQDILRSGGLMAYARRAGRTGREPESAPGSCPVPGLRARPASWPGPDSDSDAGPGAAANSESGVESGADRRAGARGAAVPRPDAPRTLAEKILLRHLPPGAPAPGPGEGVFVRADWRFSHDYFTGMCAHLMHEAFGRPAPLHDPASIVAFHDHLALAGQSVPHVRGGLLPGVAGLVDGHRDFVRDYPVRAHGELPGGGSEGICHAVMAERYALPGQVVAGTDSHTPHSGALGCLAFGAGATEIAYSWVTGRVRCRVPQTLRIEIDGRLAPGVAAKDVVLHLLGTDAIRAGEGIGAVFEYGGEAVRAMSIDERATLTNMVAELGGFAGIVEPDARTAAFLRERRGVAFAVEPWMRSDPDAAYRGVVRLDASAIGPMVARPGDPGNGVPVDGLPEPVAVDIAYGGSCTAGKREDFDCYHAVLKQGLAQGRRVSPRTRLYLQFGTMDVRRYCEARGYLPVFEAAGAILLMPGCGACANCGPGQSTAPDEVTVSAINRNFPGRSGPGQVWLASPYTVAASALAGRIARFAAEPGTAAPA